eukprot:5996157-Prorocentrum_lima.AAC.1
MCIRDSWRFAEDAPSIRQGHHRRIYHWPLEARSMHRIARPRQSPPQPMRGGGACAEVALSLLQMARASGCAVI